MSLDRERLKAAGVAVLDTLADVHPLGHQESKAARYLLSASGGVPIEVMFEKDAGTPANLWAHARAAGSLVGGTIPQKHSPAAALRTKIGKDGRPAYGRHSALEKMSQLGDADLICFAPRTLSELGSILDQLLTASAARITL